MSVEQIYPWADPARKRKLTPRQQRFIEEYLVDLSATQAAVRAGYSPRTAEQMGYKLVQKRSVSLAIQKGLQERAERTQITADMVLCRLWELGHSEDGHVAVKALELVGKHLRLFPDRHEVSGRDGDPIEIRWVETILDSRVVEAELVGNVGGIHPGDCGAGV